MFQPIILGMHASFQGRTGLVGKPVKDLVRFPSLKMPMFFFQMFLVT